MKLDRVIGYLKMSKTRQLIMRARDAWKVVAYIDAAFGCHLDGKSHSGCVICVGGATVHVISRKQKIVTKDSTEAELVALSDMLIELELCVDFLREQAIQLDLPIVFQDNTSTITLVTTGGGKPRTKHFRVRQESVREKVRAGDFEVRYLSTTSMLADALTKPLQGELYRNLTDQILGANASTTGTR